ncbi:MAG: hypothetical protein HYX77_08510 [Acidobacteria bacterium]|nr:hypothetical protein [Acidobacteriota bacterium]
MRIRWVLTVAVAVAALAGASAVVVAQKVDRQTRREQERRSQQEQRDLQALVQMVDAVTAGKQPAPADIGLRWEGNHFLKSTDQLTYIPFTVAIDATKLAAPGTALYVRVVNKPAAATPAPAAEQGNRGRDQKSAPVVYPWDNVYFVDVPPDGKVSRAIAVKPGEYEVLVAVKEKSPREPQRNQLPAKAGLLRRDLTVPDFNGPELSISSVFIGAVEQQLAPLTTEQQQENPYTFGNMRVVPSTDFKLKKSGELQVLFWIYGTQQASGKPDVQIDFNFHLKTADGEKYFNKTAPQLLNASTLPPQFDVAAGHQLPGSLIVPLVSFPVGDYRLEMKLTDKVSGKTLTYNASFTVEA